VWVPLRTRHLVALLLFPSLSCTLCKERHLISPLFNRLHTLCTNRCTEIRPILVLFCRLRTLAKTMGGVLLRSVRLFALLLFPSLSCTLGKDRQLIFLFLNSFRTLCQKHPGVPQLFPIRNSPHRQPPHVPRQSHPTTKNLPGCLSPCTMEMVTMETSEPHRLPPQLACGRY
jgi:hypothetical protein